MLKQLHWLLLLCSFWPCFAQNRKISMFINPGCNNQCRDDESVLIHIRADGPNDTLHHVWDFTNKPTVILALSSLDTSLLVNWTRFLKYDEGAMEFSTVPFYTFSFVFDEIIEFNDVNNTAVYDPNIINSSYAVVHKTNLKWKLDKYVNLTNYGSVVMTSIPQHHNHHLKKGKISVMLSAFGTTEHSDLQPHLLHTTTATQIDVQLEGLPTTSNFKSKFALGLVLASADLANLTMSHLCRKSFDDEHSPGIFTIGEVKAKKGYLEWRSVAYTSSDRLMTDSTGVNSDLIDLPDNKRFHHTAILSLFGPDLVKMLRKGVYVSFGEPGDSMSSSNGYISWSFLSGVGEPGHEGFSLLILLIVGFGIGVPTLLIAIGAICIVLKRISQQQHSVAFTHR